MEPGLVAVDIFGKSYTVRSGEDADYVGELARHVDARMRQVAARTSTVDTQRIAVLAALHIADEYVKLHRRHEQLEREMRRRSAECSDLLDECLDGRSGG